MILVNLLSITKPGLPQCSAGSFVSNSELTNYIQQKWYIILYKNIGSREAAVLVFKATLITEYVLIIWTIWQR